MSCVVDLSQINDFHRHNIRCVRVSNLENLNYMLQHKWVISVYHDTIASMVVYYIDDDNTSDNDFTKRYAHLGVSPTRSTDTV